MADRESTVPLLRSRFMLVALLAFASCSVANSGDNTLYDELGGEPGVHEIVQQLLLQLAKSDVVKPHFKSINIAGFRARLEMFICETADGPCTYDGRSMREAHATLNIDRRVFNHLVADLITAMDIAGIDYAAQNGLLARLAVMEADIVTDKPFDRAEAAESKVRSLDNNVATRVPKNNK